MSFIKKWFGKEEPTPIYDKESINVIPEVKDERTPKDLFDSAVREVTHLRVQRMIEKQVLEQVKKEVDRQFNSFRLEFASMSTSQHSKTSIYVSERAGRLSDLRDEYPRLTFSNFGVSNYEVKVNYEVKSSDILKYLADRYMEEVYVKSE